jgi:YVTN family beta-propeller protein
LLRKVKIANSTMTMRLAGEALYVLCTSPRRLVRLALPSLREDWVAPLPADPVDLDISPDGKWLAISYGGNRAIGFFDIAQQRAFDPVAAGGDVGTVRFQPDSSQLIAADLSGRRLSIYQTGSRRLIVNLPLAVRPDHLCFSPLGGQLFVTGDGMDGVVVVYPYYTPEVAETVLAGHTPGAMAAVSLGPPQHSPEAPDEGYLFVANAQSGDVSILDIATHKLLAVTPVGSGPEYVAITPDRQYALVLNETSGDMAVIRIANITRTVNEQRRWKKGALFMLIPVGSKPVSATVVAI